MPNERLTENWVQAKLSELGYEDPSIRVEQQTSEIVEVRKLLRQAGKGGAGGRGAPEFIITSSAVPDFIIVIECKALRKQHESNGLDQPKNFAMDGALHYAKSLAASFHVIAIGVSGQKAGEMKVGVHLMRRGSQESRPLCRRDGKAVTGLLPFDDFLNHAAFDAGVEQARTDDLMTFSRELHDFMWVHAKLTEGDKPLLVSGTLIALRNKAFCKGFADYAPEKLQRRWFEVIKEEIEDADIPMAKKQTMVQPYSAIAVHPELGKDTRQFPRGILHELISRLHQRVWPFLSVYENFDVVGQFYGEFLKYTGGDKKALGIVLTPRHVSELFSCLANVGKKSKVLDLCCGTAGFLISAMVRMLREAETERERNHIRQNCLVGVEQQPNMYALAASNMILRGDGKANLYQGSCFDPEILAAVNRHGCDVGMINPPYAQRDEESRELVFVRTMMDCLAKGGTGVAIVPMSCVIGSGPQKEELLRNHTLEAVMSMPDELFYPVGVVTCVMVMTAGVPHAVSNRKTWFGYWKSDGFIKTKHRGRVDAVGGWPEVRDHWVGAFRNRDDIAGESIKKHVTSQDEWCAEAYMETDYSLITREQFERTVRDHILHRAVTGRDDNLALEEAA